MFKRFSINKIPYYIVKVLLMPLGLEELATYWYDKNAYKKIEKLIHWADIEYVDTFETNKSVEINNTIWVYWRQGFEYAPDIVKKCLINIEKNKGDQKVIVLSERNVGDYISLPDFIEEKHRKGIIGEAHYSDMIRAQLLITYGGIWLDSTCYLSNIIPDVVKKTSFFMFSSGNWWHWIHNPSKCSNWFIKSDQGSPILRKTRNFLFEHWRRRDSVIHYFVFHYALSALTELDEECRMVWNNMPFVSNLNPHFFAHNFKEVYEEPRYSNVVSQCFVHKLSYRFDKRLLAYKGENFIQHYMNQ